MSWGLTQNGFESNRAESRKLRARVSWGTKLAAQMPPQTTVPRARVMGFWFGKFAEPENSGAARACHGVWLFTFGATMRACGLWSGSKSFPSFLSRPLCARADYEATGAAQVETASLRRAVPIWKALRRAGVRSTGRQRFGEAVRAAWREKHRAKDRGGPRGDCSFQPGAAPEKPRKPHIVSGFERCDRKRKAAPD